MEIGKRIAALREAKGWTTNRLANQCGLSQSFLWAVEQGEKGISVENLMLVCQALGVSMRRFFEEEEPARDALADRLEGLTQAQREALARFLETMER